MVTKMESILAILLIIAIIISGSGLYYIADLDSRMARLEEAIGAVPAPTEFYLRFSGWGAGATEIELYETMLHNFMEENPKYYVKYEPMPTMYHENLLSMFGAYVAPDVFYVDSMWVPTFLEKGALYPVEELTTPEFIDMYYDFLLEIFKDAEGKLYGLPKDWSMLFLLYNKKLFADAGLTEPPDTWAKLLEYSEKIADTTGKPGLSIYTGGFERYLPVALSEGAPKPIFNSAADAAWFERTDVKDTLKWYVELYTKGKTEREAARLTPYVVSPADIGKGWLGDAFGSESVAMVISGNWIIPFLADEFPDFEFGTDWDIAPVPKGSWGRANMAFTVCLGINRYTKYPSAAWHLVEYLMGVEGQKKLVVEMGHTLPSIEELATSPDLWPQHRKTLDYLTTPGYDVVMAWFMGPKSGELGGKFSTAIELAMLGEVTVDDALTEMYNAVVDAFAE